MGWGSGGNSFLVVLFPQIGGLLYISLSIKRETGNIQQLLLFFFRTLYLRVFPTWKKNKIRQKWKCRKSGLVTVMVGESASAKIRLDRPPKYRRPAEDCHLLQVHRLEYPLSSAVWRRVHARVAAISRISGRFDLSHHIIHTDATRAPLKCEYGVVFIIIIIIIVLLLQAAVILLCCLFWGLIIKLPWFWLRGYFIFTHVGH